MEKEFTYGSWRKRFLLYAEGELLLGMPPGSIARELISNMQGEAHELLIDVDRSIIYRTADPASNTISGLEHLLAMLDTEFGVEEEEAEEDHQKKFENHVRKRGMTMKAFRHEHHKLYKKANEKCQLTMSNSYRARRLLERARITKKEKDELLRKVDAD